MPTEKQLANLIPQNKRTKNEQREIAKKAGIKSGESRRIVKTFRELLNEQLTEKDQDKKSIKELITNKLIKTALKGNLKAIEMIRDTVGEKPTDKIETSGSVQIQKVFVTPEMQTEADRIIDDKLKKYYKNS